MAHVYVDSNAGGAGTGADWANAYTTLAAALTGSAVAGNQFWVAQDHAESAGATKTFTSPGTDAAPCTIICVNKAGTVPPVAADFRTTASITTTGTFGLVFGAGTAYTYGIIFNNGTGAGSIALSFGSLVSHWRLKNCALNIVVTSASTLTYGGSNGNSSLEFEDCTFSFANVSSGISFASGTCKITGGSICATGTVVTGGIFRGGGGRVGRAIIRDVDMTNLAGSSKLLTDNCPMVDLTIINCKTGSGFTKKPVTPARSVKLIVQNVSSADVNYELEHHAYEGSHEPVTTVKRTGGYSDGTVGLSQRFTTLAGAAVAWPFEGLPIPGWRDSEGSNITVTVEGVADPRHFSALPTNSEFWLDLDYFGTASNPLGIVKSGKPATILTAGSAYAASTEAWDAGATARANTTVYAAGDVIKLASNPGRIFICTTGGTTAGSEPAGYASAVDGGSVTDNTATFKAAWRFKATVTTTAAPQNKGELKVFPAMAKASSVIYLDPKLAVA